VVLCPEVAERAYELIQTDRDGKLSEEERNELDHSLRPLRTNARILPVLPLHKNLLRTYH
jgi:hypothetical protein